LLIIKIVRIWDTRLGKQVLKLTGHSDNVRALIVSEDGKWVCSKKIIKLLILLIILFIIIIIITIIVVIIILNIYNIFFL